MNATFLILSTAWMASAEPAPAHVHPAPAPVVVGTAGCGGCGAAPATACDDHCGPRMGLFARIRAKLSCKKSCEPACPAPCAPAPVACAKPCAPAPCAPACGTPMVSHSLFTGHCDSGCDPCGTKMGFFNRLKGKLCHKKSDDCCAAAPASTGCHTGPAMVAPGGAVPPKEMPAPPKEEVKPKTTTQAPDALRIPELGGTAGKY